jgi:hypothetical protein
MAAAELHDAGDTRFSTLPVELKYFDGGERIESGPLYPPKLGAGVQLDEIIQISPKRKYINIRSEYNDSLTKLKYHQAKKIVGLDIGVKNEIYLDESKPYKIYKIYVLNSNNNPVYYSGMTIDRSLNGLKTVAVIAAPEARGQGLGWKIYDAMAKRFNVSLYSDDSQTDDSKIGIWSQLIKRFPKRVVAYDKVTDKDIPLTSEVLARVYKTPSNDNIKNSDNLLLKLLSQ